MAHWSSPNERNTPTEKPWRRYKIGSHQVSLSVLESDLTLNMYGDTTETYDLRIRINSNDPTVPSVNKKLPGKVLRIRMKKRGLKKFLILELEKREYAQIGTSNQVHSVKRKFVMLIPGGRCFKVPMREPDEPFFREKKRILEKRMIDFLLEHEEPDEPFSRKKARIWLQRPWMLRILDFLLK